MKSIVTIVLAVVSLLAWLRPAAAIDAASLGTVYGKQAGLDRVQALETQLANLTIQSGHPRIVLTPELIARAQARAAAHHYKWSSIQAAAATDPIAAAFCYLVTGAGSYATTVYDAIMAGTATPWTDNYRADSNTGTDRKVAEWSIAFDWAYNGLTQTQRDTIVAKIAAAANIAGRAAWIRAGNRITSSGGETFHREEWIFWAWRAWPELALAGHVTDADFCYKSRWNYDSIYGDAARAFAYLGDGTPLEGYQYGADATSWFMALKSATGINLVDGTDFAYAVSAADYQLYGTDFGLNRNVFHHGVGLGAGGLATYTDTVGNEWNWKTKEYHSLATQLTAASNPYQQWFAKNPLTFDKRGASSWIFTNEYYNYWSSFEDISTLLFYDPSLPAADPRSATHEQLPFAKHFPGGNEVYMRSSWGNDAALACFRSTPAFTKTSHGDFDVNTFLLYRKGNLAPDSGVYDAYQGQVNYTRYQKNTVAHNNLLIIDPIKPDDPKKFNATPDPGGTEFTTTRTFGNLNPLFPQTANTFLLNSKANWGDVVGFETTRLYDYTVGEAAKAYGTRSDEYSRSVLFLRKPGDKAYVAVYDRVNATNANFKKKWLLHTVNEPTLNGSTTDTEVEGHIYTTDGDSYVATNVFNDSALYGKVLLPHGHRIRKVGGAGYEFWVDGATAKNWGIDWSVLAADKEPFMGGPIQEIGQWRLELMPATQQQRDLFLNVIYLGDVGETPAPVVAVEAVEGTMTGAYIQDSSNPFVLLFSKGVHGTPVSGTVSYDLGTQTVLPAWHIVTGLEADADYTVVRPASPPAAQLYQIVRGADPLQGGVLRTSSQGVLKLPPTISIQSPTPGATIAGKKTITVSVPANFAAATYTIYADGAVVASNLPASGPILLDTLALAEGVHSVAVEAVDSDGNKSVSAPVAVTVVRDTDPPAVAITNVVSESEVLDTVAVNISATDNFDVEVVKLYVDDVFHANAAPSYSVSWDTTALLNGHHVLYAKAFDSSGNVGTSASVGVTVANDAIAPVLTGLTVPATSNSLTVSVTIAATDNKAVTGYLVSENGATPTLSDPAWSAALPASYSFNSSGSKTLYAWVRDRAGNLSGRAAASVAIESAAPTVTSFVVPPVSESLVVPVRSFSASDNVAVTGYLITQSATPPSHSQAGWSATYPTSFTVSSAGVKTLYAWAKDAAGNVSAGVGATVATAGAANTNGTVTVSDALLALRFSLGVEVPTPEQKLRSDVAPVRLVNGVHEPVPDQKIDVADVLVILRLALGIHW